MKTSTLCASLLLRVAPNVCVQLVRVLEPVLLLTVLLLLAVLVRAPGMAGTVGRTVTACGGKCSCASRLCLLVMHFSSLMYAMRHSCPHSETLISINQLSLDS